MFFGSADGSPGKDAKSFGKNFKAGLSSSRTARHRAQGWSTETFGWVAKKDLVELELRTHLIFLRFLLDGALRPAASSLGRCRNWPKIRNPVDVYPAVKTRVWVR